MSSSAESLSSHCGAPAPGRGSQARSAGRRGAVSAIAVIIALSLSCGDSSTEPTPVAPPVTGSITGQVSIEGTGIDGVSVNLSNGDATTTSGGGNYRLDNIEGGAYTVTISGYPSDATFDATSAAATISAAGQSVTVNFTGSYIRSASIMGTVSVENVGLSGVAVRLSGMADAETATDNDGQYAFTGLRAGDYSVEISGFDSEEVAFEFTSSSAAIGVGEAAIVSFDGIYLRTAGIQGQVSADGQGLAGVTVSLTGGPDNVSETTMTDASGQYAFAKLRAGDYVVGISGYDTDDYEFEATSINVAVALGETANVAFEGMLLRTSGIAGRVSVEGLGLPDITVTLSGADMDDKTAMTDASGQYAFAGLAAGDYTVAISGQDMDAYAFDEPSKNVTVGNNESAIVNFEGTYIGGRGDRAILVALYNATDGPNWVNNDNWLTDAPLGDWYGVDMDASGRVVRIDLGGRYVNDEWVSHRLSGQIPAELGKLDSLQGLSLHRNDLTGPVPPQLGNLANLERLSLHGNDLSGAIPARLGNLANLERLSLHGNDLSGAIPARLGNLANLKYLGLSANRLTGPIPPELGNLANLQKLQLVANRLSGPIPRELGNLANLEELSLYYNALTGSIPSELGSLTKLGYLALSNNRLTGQIPPELGNLTDLYSLYLSGNALTGPVPAELGNLASLEWFHLDGNSDLAGAIPLEYQRLSLRQFWWFNTGLCSPPDASFQAWLGSIGGHRGGPVCRSANRAPEPVGSIPGRTMKPGERASLDASSYFSDPDSDELSHTVNSSNTSVATVAVSDNTVTVEAVAEGSATIRVTARDPGGLSAVQTFEVTVKADDADFKPLSGLTITTSGAIKFGGITNSGCLRGNLVVNGVRYDIHWTEWQRRIDGGAWTQVAGTRKSGELCGYDLTNASAGEYRFVGEMTVNGVRGRYRSENTVTIGGGTNQSPVRVGTIADRSMKPGDSGQVDASDYFRDPDGDALTYAASSSNTSVATVAVAGNIVTVTAVAEGSATIRIAASDPGGLSAEQSFRVTVASGNRSPVKVGSIGDRSIKPGERASFDASSYFSDPDGDDLSYTAASSNTSVATVAVSGSSVTVAAVAEGSATIRITATDPGGLSAVQAFEATVKPDDGDFKELKGLVIGNDGGVTLSVGGVTLSIGHGGCMTSTGTINGKKWDFHWTAWQRDAGSGWADLPGTRQSKLCAYDLTSAPDGKYRLVGDMTIEGVRGRYKSENVVTVGGSGGAGFRDDFGSTASLSDWELTGATAAIDNGVLRLTNSSYEGSAERSLDSPVTSWTLKARMGRTQTTDSRVALWWETGHTRYPYFMFKIGTRQGRNYDLYTYDTQDGLVVALPGWWGNSDAIRDGANELTDIELSYKNGVLKTIAGGTELFALPYSPNGWLGPALTNVTRVGLVTDGTVGNTGLFDWVEIEGAVRGGGD